MTIKIKELPEMERPYEKLELYGAENLSNAELLAIIIKTGTKDETSVQVAQKILKLDDTQKDLNFLRNTTIEELTQIKGIGKVKAIQIKAVVELAIRMAKPTNYKKIKINTPDDIANILMEELRFQKREIAKIILLNNKNEILKIKDLCQGGENFVNVTIKDILEEPIKTRAPKILLVHNHPSGNSEPSTRDIQFTETLYDIAKAFNIELMDHLVIGDQKYTSIFTQMLENKEKNYLEE